MGSFPVSVMRARLGQQPDHVLDDLGGALLDLLVREHGHRVGRGGVLVAGCPAQLGHLAGGRAEGVGDDHRGGQAGGLEHHAVRRGGRAARAAVADAGDDHVGLGGQLLDDLLRLGDGEVELGSLRDAGGAVLLPQEAAHLKQEGPGVLLRVDEKADPGARQRAAARGAGGGGPPARRVAPVGSRIAFGMVPSFGGPGGSSPGGDSMLVNDDAADVLAVHEVGVALVDLIQRVPLGDELVQLDLALVPEAEDLRDVVQRVGPAE